MIDFNIERFLVKPTTPIEPDDDCSKMYVVSHIPHPMYYKKLKEKNISNDRIKAVVDADEWWIFLREVHDKVQDSEVAARNEALKYIDETIENQRTITRLSERVKELEGVIKSFKDILYKVQADENKDDSK